MIFGFYLFAFHAVYKNIYNLSAPSNRCYPMGFEWLNLNTFKKQLLEGLGMYTYMYIHFNIH